MSGEGSSYSPAGGELASRDLLATREPRRAGPPHAPREPRRNRLRPRDPVPLPPRALSTGRIGRARLDLARRPAVGRRRSRGPVAAASSPRSASERRPCEPGGCSGSRVERSSLWLTFEVLRPASLDDENFADHLVSFLKFVEYALLAVAVPLLIRVARDLGILLGGLVLWGAVATAVAVLQLFGSDIFEVSTSGWRYSSFLGRHDLAALSAVSAGLAAAAIVARRTRTPVSSLVPIAGVGGVLGLVLAGSVTRSRRASRSGAVVARAGGSSQVRPDQAPAPGARRRRPRRRGRRHRGHAARRWTTSSAFLASAATSRRKGSRRTRSAPS